MMAYGKAIFTYIILLGKRMCKTPGYVLSFILVPCILFGISYITSTDTNQVYIAFALETSDGANHGDDAQIQEETFLAQLKEILCEKEGTIQFVYCRSEQEVMEMVAKAEAECGYYIPANLYDRLDRMKLNRVIKSYESPQTSMRTLCDEVFFAEVFALYEETAFGTYAGELIFEALQEYVPEAASHFGEMEHKDLNEQAHALFDTYMYNGSTFAFSYEVYGQDAKEEKNIAETQTTKLFNVKKIGAWVLFICALCGTLDCLEDEGKRRTVRLQYRKTFRVLTIYAPVAVMSLFLFGLLLLTGNGGNPLHEILRLIAYQFILVLYCFLIKAIWKNEEKFVAVMPTFILMSAVVCPIFVDLKRYVPIFEWLEKLFPITYYLA